MKKRNLKINDDWKTPQDLYDSLDKEFHFDFDPCPFKHDITLWNGLEIEWGCSNFVNPPYSRKLKEEFIRKAYLEYLKNKIVVMLLPVSTSTKIFHEIIYPNCEIRFLKGRVKFEGLILLASLFVTNAECLIAWFVFLDLKHLPLSHKHPRNKRI